MFEEKIFSEHVTFFEGGGTPLLIFQLICEQAYYKIGNHRTALKMRCLLGHF